MTKSWKVSDILDMQGEDVQFAHVAKHLYNKCEHWEHAIPDLGDAFHKACKAGCAHAKLKKDYPKCSCVTPQCKAHVLRDHDELLSPAYRDALKEAEEVARFGLLDEDRSDGRAWMYVGDQGVIVIVREVKRPRRVEVKTAYRADCECRNTDPNSFFKEAVRKLRDKTSWNGGGS